MLILLTHKSTMENHTLDMTKISYCSFLLRKGWEEFTLKNLLPELLKSK